MFINHDLTIDLLRPQRNTIHVTQQDSTHRLRLKLMADNTPYNVAASLSQGEQLLAFVEYRRCDGVSGMYDTTSREETAVELEDVSVNNVWLVRLDGYCFTTAGWTQINVRFETEDGKLLHSFPITAEVIPAASSNSEPSGQPGLNSIADLRNAVSELAIIVENMAGTTGLTESMKQALLNLLNNVIYANDDGPTYLDVLQDALYPPAVLLSISSDFEQGSAVIYDIASLDSLKQYLTVTARYNDGTSKVLTDEAYTLSGTLSVGTSTITVSYAEHTDTFNVVVTPAPELESISATYTQSGVVYSTDSLDVLIPDLVVTATWSDSTTTTVPSTDYTLSGTLTGGTSVITVTYGEQTTTFNVTVTRVAYTGLVDGTYNTTTGSGSVSVSDNEITFVSVGSYMNVNIPLKKPIAIHNGDVVSFTYTYADASPSQPYKNYNVLLTNAGVNATISNPYQHSPSTGSATMTKDFTATSFTTQVHSGTAGLTLKLASLTVNGEEMF